LAKTHRDEIMETLHTKHEIYAWQKNKGYPTVDHRAAIRTHGACEHHRMSFTLLPEQLALDF
jgi:ribonuclease HII